MAGRAGSHAIRTSLRARDQSATHRSTSSVRVCYTAPCGVEQWPARWAHNPKVSGSNPFPATTVFTACGAPCVRLASSTSWRRLWPAYAPSGMPPSAVLCSFPTSLLIRRRGEDVVHEEEIDEALPSAPQHVGGAGRAILPPPPWSPRGGPARTQVLAVWSLRSRKTRRGVPSPLRVPSSSSIQTATSDERSGEILERRDHTASTAEHVT